MKKIIPVLLMCIIAILVASPHAQAGVKDVRGVWVSTVYSMDYPLTPTTSPATLKAKADAVLDNCVKLGMNTVYLQVRPASDAIYKSNIYPWSKYLTGTQGVAPTGNFDPLTYWVDAAHQRGIELHAWINPYRVAISTVDYNALAPSSPGRLHPDWVYEYDGKYYFDPGLPAVRQMVIDGAKEIVDNYGVDGIHLDDYFYPGDGTANTDTFDAGTFASYPNGFSDKGNWRRNNNNLLIKGLQSTIKKSGKAFGVSPAGIWANKTSMSNGSLTKGNQTYFSAYADTRKWVKEGWIDYICPQIYWPIGYSIADYKVLANWWADVVSGTGVELYIGMADYRYLEATNPWTDFNIIKSQLELNATIPQITGEVHFRYKSIMDLPELRRLYETEYAGASQNMPLLVSPTAPHEGFMQGDNGAFHSESSLTRAEISTVLSRLIVDANGNKIYNANGGYGNSFKDVAPGAWYASAIGFMESQGILKGYSDGTFRPDANVSRAECATLLSRFFSLRLGLTNNFWDVPSSHWAKKAIVNCSAKGYVNGYGDGTFKPDNAIKRCEAVKMVNKILAREPNTAYFDNNPGVNIYSDVNSSHWAYYEILEASCSHPVH